MAEEEGESAQMAPCTLQNNLMGHCSLSGWWSHACSQPMPICTSSARRVTSLPQLLNSHNNVSKAAPTFLNGRSAVEVPWQSTNPAMVSPPAVLGAAGAAAGSYGSYSAHGSA